MSRSKRDQKGKRINGEIWGRSCFQISDGKVFPVHGGERVGSPGQKKWSKVQAARLRRRTEKIDKVIAPFHPTKNLG